MASNSRAMWLRRSVCAIWFSSLWEWEKREGKEGRKGSQVGQGIEKVAGMGTKDTRMDKVLSHEIFGPVYWPVWMHLGLNKNRFWFLNFEEAPAIWGSHFKFWCVSFQTFSEILRISEKDWQLRTQLPILLRELGTQLPILLRELGTQLPIILGESTILREIFTP
jgi:hypothetical protein